MVGLRSLFRFCESSDWVLAGPAVAVSIGNAVLIPVLTVLMGIIFSALSDFSLGQLSSSQFMSKVLQGVLGIFTLGVASVFLGWGMVGLWGLFGDNLVKRIRTLLLRSLLYKPMEYFDSSIELMGLLSLAHRNIDEVRMADSMSLAISIYSFASIVASLGLSFYHSWSLTLVSLAGLPVVVAVAVLCSIPVQRHLTGAKRAVQSASDSLVWSISAVTTVKLFQREHTEFVKFRRSLRSGYAASVRMYIYMNVQEALSRVLVLLMLVQSFSVGAILIRKGVVDSGSVLIVFWCCMSVAQSFRNLSPQLMFLQKGIAAADQLGDLVGTDEDGFKLRRSIGLYPAPSQGAIAFNKVSFKYPARNELALKDFSMRILPGSLVFIIGRSGCGKSTLGSLLLKQYAVTNGSIYVDDLLVDTISPRWLSDNIYVCEQESFIVDIPIEENIKLGSLMMDRPSTQDVEKAADDFGVSAFARNLPGGLHSLPGSKGSKLSGGQKQRVALARARMRNAPIMIFDESFSALDGSLRQRMLNAVREYRRGRTTLIITHDLAIIRKSDYVFYMEDGAVVEKGYREGLDCEGSKFSSLAQYSPSLEESFEAESNCTSESSSREVDDFPPACTLTSRHSPYAFDKGRVELQALDKVRTKSGTRVEYEEVGSALDFTGPTALKTDLDMAEKAINWERSSKLRTATMIIRLLRTVPDKGLLLLGIASAVANGITNPMFSFAFSNLLTGVIQTSALTPVFPGLVKWTLIVVSVACADGITTLGKSFADIASERWLLDVRQNCFRKLMTMDMTWYDNQQHAASVMTTLLMNDSESVRLIFTRYLTGIANCIALGMCAVAWAMIVGWKLSLVGISCLPLFYLTSSWFQRVMTKWEAIYRDETNVVVNLMSEIINGIRSVKILSLERYFAKQVAIREDSAWEVGIRQATYIGMGYGINQIFVYLCQGTLLWYGMKLVSTGEYDIKSAMMVFALLLFSLVTLQQVVGTLPELANAFETCEQLISLIDLKRRSEVFHTPSQQRWGVKGVRFQDVYFSYGQSYGEPSQELLVLAGLSFELQEHETVALVGSSGSGKSTVARLLTKLYSPLKGSVHIDGRSIQEMSDEEVRRSIAVVDQMPLSFFEGSIADNIRYGLEDSIPASEARDRIEDACRDCGIHDFISSLEKGYDTPIGNSNGGNGLLSGGQLQRVGIARALVRCPKLLILDECTSSLDADSMKCIKRFIERRRIVRDMTLLVITHQDEISASVDRIIKI